jgi:hypothetical protein
MIRARTFASSARFLLLAGAACVLVAASTARLDYFKVEEEDNTLVIRWLALEESQVRTYEIYRATPSSNHQFVRVSPMTPHGPNRPYEYRDTQVFKAGGDDVIYRLEGLMRSGERVTLAEQSVSYSPTAVRRTWGSIKAMFQ